MSLVEHRSDVATGLAPVALALKNVVGAPVLHVPFGHASGSCHLHKQRLRHANLLVGKMSLETCWRN